MEATTAAPSSRGEEILAGHRRYLFPCVRPYYDHPVVLERGRGSRVWDAEGTEYLDFFGGILTTSVGHAHPEVTARTREQLERLGHTSTLYVTEAQVEAARRLAALAPGGLRRTFFTNSGSEAVETALALARIHTGRSEIVALRMAYHGRTTLASHVTAQAPWRPLAASAAGVSHARAPYPYRCPFRRPCDEGCVDALIQDLEETVLTTTNGRPAAFIAETIQGVSGYVVPPPSYFRRAAELIRGFGGLLVIDEVQAGFGRTGSTWFGIEHWGVEPDIMVLAKGIAGGMPVGATLTRDEIAASWTGKTISTFGGHPVAMASMAATLDVLRREDAPANAERRGRRLRSGLEELAARHPWIGDVRGMGLMQALELVEPADAAEPGEPDPGRARALLEATRERGLLVGLGGFHNHVIRLGPNLLVTDAEVEEALERLDEACGAVA